MRIVVIGAGLGGLSAACHLVARGHEVTVVERHGTPGGRAGRLALAGYEFDTGPTVLTMPELFQRCFDAVGVEMADYLTVRPLDPMYRATFADGTHLRVMAGRDAMATEIRDVCGPREAEAFHRFAQWLTELYECEMPGFIDRNYDSPLDLLRPLPPSLRLLRLRAFSRLGARVAHFFDDERLQRVFSFQSLYAGLAPHRALSVYAVITYMDAINGVVVCEGGMHALPRALASAAEHAGVEFRYSTEVEQVVTDASRGGRVIGVRLVDGELIGADVVVCNADLPEAYRTLLPHLSPQRAVRRGHYSPSAAVWHLGVKGDLPANASHHNIHFGQSWEPSFRALLDEGRRMPDPSLLVSIPSLDDPSMAPPDGHSLYVLEPVPNLDADIHWPRERERLRGDLERALTRFGYPVDIQAEALVDPLDWQRDGLARGTPFGLAHTFLQTGPFRPRNLERRAPGLVFVGSSTVPGVGVPMVILSGELAARRVAAMEHA